MSSMADERYDSMLLAIAQQQAGGIEGLLDIFLSFLRRKTDFFSGGGEGYPRVEQTVIAGVKRQHSIYLADEKSKAAKRAKAASSKPISSVPELSSLPVEDNVFIAGSNGSFDITEAPKAVANTGSAPAKVEQVALAPSASAPSDATAVPDGAATAGIFAPGPGNGLRTERYAWTQTLQDVSIVFPVPAGVKGKDISVDIRSKRLKVCVRGMGVPARSGGAAGAHVILDVELARRVHADDSNWTLDDSSTGRAVTVFLSKENAMEWWDSVGAAGSGEPVIDVSKVEPENSKLSDLDGETRKTVEKMMFDQRQKQQGLPSSDELTKQDMMKKFMSAHPEMDFSQAKFM